MNLGTVYALEIDFLDFNTVYISGNGGVYKSIDGGNTWNIVGDVNFTSLSHSVKDIKLNPSDNNILFVATDEGLFKSTNAGNSFNTIMTGNFLEIEFHPNSSDTMYFVKQA